jgi:ATP-binding cassette subfamily B protein
LSQAEPAAPRPKAKSLRPLSRLLPFLAAYRGHLVAALVALLVASAASLAVPVAVRRVIDHGFSGGNLELVNQYFGTMIGVVLALAVGSAARFYFVMWIGERVVADLRDAVFRHLLALSAAFYETVRTGEVVSRLTADTTQIKSAFGASASIALRNMVLLAGAVGMMIYTSPKLSLMTLGALPLIILPLVISGRRVRKLSRAAQDTLADSAAMAQESLGAVQTIQAFGQQSRLTKMFETATFLAFDTARQRTLARAVLTGAIIFLSTGSIVGVLWYGARDVLDGNLTGGALTQFVLYAAFAAGAMGALSEVWGELQLAAGAAERISELLDTKPQITAPAKPKPLPATSRGEVCLKNVHFSYPTRPKDKALRAVSLHAGAGETVAIVGPSGAGKSTIFGLFLRAYDVQRGSVEVDGVNVREADPDDVRARIAIVPQDPVIFSASILDNIRFGKPDADEAAVRRAADAARVTEFAKKLPQGFDTEVGERGITLSGGQRQRIAIARAILRDAPILLLDEATSALDAESEHAVQEAFQKLMQGRTTLVIAHRLATVRNADRILVMQDGEIIAEGRHGALMKKGGLYARLAKLQFA